jgi:hypothetical protein
MESTIGKRDAGIQTILKDNMKPIKQFSFDIIILDESQDINPLYYGLICKINIDNEKTSRLCVLGDRYQSIYSFNGADGRYITQAMNIFNYQDDTWQSTTLSTSFRITNQMASFINRGLLKNERIKARKDSDKVRYIICDTFGDVLGSSDRTYEEIKYYLDKGYGYEDIFILAPSVKSTKSPVRQLANKLTEESIPIFVPNSDEEKLDKSILKHKIVFSTFHQVKGLERKVVIVFNFDNSYFKFYKKDAPTHICPNEIYVATTRASEHLSIFHHQQNDYLPFIDVDQIKKTCYFEEQPLYLSENSMNMNIETSVTNLIKHLPSHVSKKALSFLKVKEIKKVGNFINIPIKINQGKFCESTSDITGTAIPAYFELKHRGNMEIYDKEINYRSPYNQILQRSKGGDNETIDPKLSKIDLKKITISQLLYVANVCNAFKSKYIYKLKQIKEYNWLSQENLDKSVKRLEEHISKDAEFEIGLELEDQKELLNRKLIGFIDCIDKNNVWEFKCVQALSEEHILQLGIYMYLYEKNRLAFDQEEYVSNNVGDTVDFKWANVLRTGVITQFYKNGTINVKVNKRSYKIRSSNIVNKKRVKTDKLNNYYLFNILDDHVMSVKSTMKELEQMIEYLVHHKYSVKTRATDEQFIFNNQKIKERYYNVILEEPVVEKKRGTNIMVLDIETDGGMSIIQIAYNIYDSEMKLIRQENFLINEDIGRRDFYKKFTLDDIYVHGKPAPDVLKRLSEDMDICKYIVGHNLISFDVNRIERYYNRYQINYSIPEMIDTMRHSKQFVNAKNKRGNIKAPKLEELVNKLELVVDLSLAHTADYDVDMTFRAFKKLVEMDIIQI